MELIRTPAINDPLKLCTVSAFLALFLLTLFLASTSPQTSLLSASTSTATGAGLAENNPPPSHPNFSDAVILQSFDPPNLEDKIFPDTQPDTTNTTSSADDLSLSEKLFSSSSSPEPDEGDRGCRMYEGKWVYKPSENPRYHVSQCNFLEEKMSCRRNGRPDSHYEAWGWESDGCRIPLFNGTYMLEKMRRKRMIIVGDSLNRNMWESLACLLYTSIPPRRAYIESANPEYKVFKAKDYKFTLEFYWAPFLVHLDENHDSGKTVLSLDQMVPASNQWRGADVMVFNSGHWWTHHGKLKVYVCSGMC